MCIRDSRYIVDLFWKELFATTLFREPSLLETELRKKDLSYTADDLFIPVSVSYTHLDVYKRQTFSTTTVHLLTSQTRQIKSSSVSVRQ